MNPASKYATPVAQGDAVVGRTHPRDNTRLQEERAQVAARVRSRGYTAEETARLLDMLGLGEVA
jgi:hypothetical protein